MATVEEIKRLLEGNGYTIKEQKRLSNNTGDQLRLSSGQIVNVFDKGTYNIQGKDPERVKKLLDRELQGMVSAGAPQVHGGSRKRQVFVVYGHDKESRSELEAMLRRWDLEPLFLDQLPSEGMTLIEKLEAFVGEVGFGVVLATPDDEGFRVGHPDEKMYRARQNVVLELGMLLALLGRSKVAILIKNPDEMERPSDIQGLIYISFKEHVEEVKLQLAKEMNAQGLIINLDRL